MLIELNWVAVTANAIALENPPESIGLIAGLEHLLRQLAQFLKIILELIAILIIIFAVVDTLKKFLLPAERRRHRTMQQSIRLDLGLSLALSLEFLLAADIVGTAVSPTQEAVLQLAAIAGIRTFLNFFLEREVKDLQRETREEQLRNE